MKNKSFVSIIIFTLIVFGFGISDKFINIENNKEDEILTLLINSNNPVDENIDIDLYELDNGIKINSIIYEDLQEMFDQMRKEGLNPNVYSGYRSYEYQMNLYNADVNKYMNQGYSEQEAINKTLEYLAYPGTSEHQLGIAVDINSLSIDNTKVYNWLNNNSYKYGFILRYPENKVHITNINYEPWHYRYVGKQHAKNIYSNDLALEEYLD